MLYGESECVWLHGMLMTDGTIAFLRNRDERGI